jgi:hypothetical protein
MILVTIKVFETCGILNNYVFLFTLYIIFINYPFTWWVLSDVLQPALGSFFSATLL